MIVHSVADYQGYLLNYKRLAKLQSEASVQISRFHSLYFMLTKIITFTLFLFAYRSLANFCESNLVSQHYNQVKCHALSYALSIFNISYFYVKFIIYPLLEYSMLSPEKVIYCEI